MKLAAGTPHGFAAVCLRRAMRCESIDLYDGGGARRDFLYVDDVVDGLLAAAALPMDTHEIYNLGHERPYRLRDFAEGLARRLPVTINEVPFPPDSRKIDIGDYYADFAKFRRATGWSPKTDLDAGLEATIAHYLVHADDYEDAPRNDVRATGDVSTADDAPAGNTTTVGPTMTTPRPVSRSFATAD
jgi:nucleoside-diphosphate-sugar epimerase